MFQLRRLLGRFNRLALRSPGNLGPCPFSCLFLAGRDSGSTWASRQDGYFYLDTLTRMERHRLDYCARLVLHWGQKEQHLLMAQLGFQQLYCQLQLARSFAHYSPSSVLQKAREENYFGDFQSSQELLLNITESSVGWAEFHSRVNSQYA
jgi:hypothetical protein